MPESPRISFVRPGLLVLQVLLLLTACAHREPEPATPVMAEWSARELPGKRATRYAMAKRDGRPCVLAQAEQSASLWRRKLQLDADRLSRIEFDWWLGPSEPRASVLVPETDDAAARLVLAFDGDVQRLSMRNRMVFELAQTLTGEAPPYATLMYVWDSSAPPETLVISAHSDRVRKIVVGSGANAKGRWQRFARDVRADFERAFAEKPGRLVGAAFMTDADNTRSRNEACYGELQFRDAAMHSLPGSLELR